MKSKKNKILIFVAVISSLFLFLICNGNILRVYSGFFYDLTYHLCGVKMDSIATATVDDTPPFSIEIENLKFPPGEYSVGFTVDIQDGEFSSKSKEGQSAPSIEDSADYRVSYLSLEDIKSMFRVEIDGRDARDSYEGNKAYTSFTGEKNERIIALIYISLFDSLRSHKIKITFLGRGDKNKEERVRGKIRIFNTLRT